MTKKSAKKAPKRGRPPLPPGARRDASIKLRLHPEERAELDAAAEAEGMTVTRLVLESIRFFRERTK